MFLYWNTSRVRNPLFFGVLFSLVTNLFFIPNTKMLFGMITLLAYRGLMIFHVIKLIKPGLYPIGIGMVPFVFVSFFQRATMGRVIIIQNILVSVLGGLLYQIM
jgi:hypothetical protein